MLGLGSSLTTPDCIKWDPSLRDLKLTIWLTARAADLTLDGTAITTWTDRISGLAYTQATANRKPAWSAANQTVTFAISPNADYLVEASTPVILDTDSTGWTIAWYGTSTDWNNTDQAFMGDAGGNNDFFRHNSGAETLSIKADGQTRTFTLTSPTALEDSTYYHIMLVCQTDGAMVLYINNVAQTDTETLGTTKDFEIDQISGKNTSSQTLDGTMKEIMVFKSPLGEDDRQGCYEYMIRGHYE